MRSFGITDKGKVRKENQDSYIIEHCDKRKCAVIAICDGMGGAKAGDLASRLACKAFVSKVFETLVSPAVFVGNHEKLLRESCADANGVVYDYSSFDSEYRGMGTTLVGGTIYKNRAHLVNIGDSRAYHITSGGIRQVTKDHSYVEELVSMGAITREEAAKHPKKNIITRALGVDSSVEADYYDVSLSKGDCILLCSDGLSNMLGDSELYAAYTSFKTPDRICSELMKTALDRGARDNVSVVVVRV